MKSFLQGKKAIEVSPLRPPSAKCQTHVGAGMPHAPLSVSTPGASSAHVEVIKEGAKVVRIVVTCTCGERIDIECLYSAGT